MTQTRASQDLLSTLHMQPKPRAMLSGSKEQWCSECVAEAGMAENQGLVPCDGSLQPYPKVGQVSSEEVASSCQGGLASACRLSLCRLLSPILHGQVHDSPVIEGLLAHARAIVPHTDEPLAGPARTASHERNRDDSWLMKTHHIACGSQGVVNQLSQGIRKGVMTLNGKSRYGLSCV